MGSLNNRILFTVAFLIFSIPACIVDIRQKRIPDRIVFSGLAVLFVIRFFVFGDSAGSISLEMLTGSLIFVVIRLLTKGKLGMGDVKFAAFMAVFTGFPGWFIAVGSASVFGLFFAITGLISGRLNKSSKIPFAPFLTVGSIGAYYLNFNPF